MATLTLALLGRFESSLDGQPLIKFRTSRVQALLAYLSTEFALGASRQQREMLMELLWPGMPPTSARANLRQNLYYLRQTIPDLVISGEEQAVPFLIADRLMVALNPAYPIDLDLVQFNALLAGPQEKWPKATKLYRGDFLADFYLPDSSPFEEWAAARRSAFRRQTLEALDALANSAVQQGQLKTAEGYARRQIEIDALGEGAYRTLMRVLTWSGRQGEALVLYEECVRLLQDEVGSPPSEATIALARTIKEGNLEAPAEAVMTEQSEAYRLPASGEALSLAGPADSEPESNYPGEGGETAGCGRLSRQTWIGLVVLAALILIVAVVGITNLDGLISADKASAENPLPAEPDLAGTTVTIALPSTDDDGKSEEAARPFEERTGINVEFIGRGLGVFDTFGNLIETGQQPDIIQFPLPGSMAEFARQGWLVDVRTFLDEAFLNEHYTDALLEAAMVGDQMPGIWHLSSVKSLVWYPKRAFEEAGYTVPQTWDDMMALSDQIVADGATPWCIGIRSDGSSTGWVGTDWVEDILLRSAPPETYDAWVAGELPFDSPEVRRAFGIMEDIWLAEGYVYGGTTGILSEHWTESPAHLLDDPPGCYFYRQASFAFALFSEDAVFGEDYDFFFLPPIDEEYGFPILGGGDLMSMVNDRPEVREVMRWLATGESVRPFVESGSQISPHRDAPFEWYSSPVQLKVAEGLFEADTYRFDGSDMMPVEVGTEPFWGGIVEWVGGEDLGQVLRTIDDSWPAENGD